MQQKLPVKLIVIRKRSNLYTKQKECLLAPDSRAWTQIKVNESLFTFTVRDVGGIEGFLSIYNIIMNGIHENLRLLDLKRLTSSDLTIISSLL